MQEMGALLERWRMDEAEVRRRMYRFFNAVIDGFMVPVQVAVGCRAVGVHLGLWRCSVVDELL